jgi:long-chain fatty acid transport protein
MLLKKIGWLFLCIFPLLTQAQGYQVNLQGQKQQGMGGAGTACIQDASVLFFNPGGAAFVEGTSVNVGMTPTIGKGLFLDQNTHQTYKTTSPVSTPFAAYGLFALKDSNNLKAGIAVYTPFGSTVDWEDKWAGRFAITHLQLEAIFIQPTISYQIGKKWGVGAGFIYSYGKVNLQKDIPLMDANGNYGHAELSGKANGFGFNAGLYYKPIKQLSIGLTYRSKVNMAVKNGQANFDVPSAVTDNFPDGKFQASLPLPSVGTLGFGIKPNDKLDIAIDINYVGWKAYDTLAFDYEANTATLIDTKSARNYKNTFAFRGGVQYKITSNFAARLGMAYGMTPVPNGYVTPETPDANRFNYTAGLGYAFGKHLRVDASFLFTHLERKDTNLETNLSGTFKTNVCAPGLAVSYNF